MRRFVPVLAATALTFITSTAGAQRSASVDTAAAETPAASDSTSSRVRLKMSRETLRSDGHYMIEGTLLDANQTRVVIERPGHAAPDTVPMFTVDHIETYAGRHSRGRMIAAGAAGGAAISLVVRGMDNLTRGNRCVTRCDKPLIPTYLYGVPVVLGAFIGSIFPAEHWVEIKRTDVSVGLAGRHELQLSSRIDFR